MGPYCQYLVRSRAWRWCYRRSLQRLEGRYGRINARLCRRLVKDGITVNAVSPSLIETDMMRGRSDLARNIPLGRMGQPGEVAQSVLMVLGNDYMTGQAIFLNGGMAFI
jgi:NAD(P)-dependent dehydrogenase (short-subunit alcohol dehydrogenase family)